METTILNRHLVVVKFAMGVLKFLEKNIGPPTRTVICVIWVSVLLGFILKNTAIYDCIVASYLDFLDIPYCDFHSTIFKNLCGNCPSLLAKDLS